MATRKKDRDPAEQSGYSTTGLDSREKVEQALAGADYTPGAQVNKAQEELQQWQTMRPEEYRSNYRDQIDRLRRGENPTVDSAAETERKQNHAQTQRKGRKYFGKR